MNKRIFNYTAVIEKDEKSGYFAYIPALSGCYTQGETYEEVVKNMQEACELYLESVRSAKEEVPSNTFVSTFNLSLAI